MSQAVLMVTKEFENKNIKLRIELKDLELTVTTKCYCCGRETKLKIYVIEVFLNDRLLIGETKALCNECRNALETILEKTYNQEAVFSLERYDMPKTTRLEVVV